MPKLKKKTTRKSAKVYTHSVTRPSIIQRVQTELESNQSYLSLVLGLLIVLVVGVLVFNYIKKAQLNLGPAQQTTDTQDSSSQPAKDVEASSLPGKYTVKKDDTLYNIALAYYKDGFKFDQIAEVNKLADPNFIEVGQVLEIPKIETATLASVGGTGGATNQTIWGERITGDTYTVVEDDWLSKIAGRAYGDIYAFDKIAKANNITDPNNIEPGTVLKIPR